MFVSVYGAQNHFWQHTCTRLTFQKNTILNGKFILRYSGHKFGPINKKENRNEMCWTKSIKFQQKVCDFKSFPKIEKTNYLYKPFELLLRH